MKFIGNIKNLDTLKALPNTPENGEVAFLDESISFVIYNGEEWKPAQVIETQPLQISLYDLNKSMILKEGKTLTDREIEAVINKFGNDDNCYYLLLNKELSHYTVFDTYKDFNHTDFGPCVVNIINSFGRIYFAEEKENGVEIWVKVEDDIYCFFLFPYDDCVIETEE